jgi:hypothetical protein
MTNAVAASFRSTMIATLSPHTNFGQKPAFRNTAGLSIDHDNRKNPACSF